MENKKKQKKNKKKTTNLPCKLTIKKMDVYNKPKIADAFNDFFINIGQKLASQIPKSSKKFEPYINKVNVIMDSNPLLINELKEEFFSLKINKSSDVDDVSFNITKKCFGVLCEPLIYLFQLSLEKGVFPDDLKIAKVTPIYKAGDSSDISNYRSILVLPCFPKVLHLYKYLKVVSTTFLLVCFVYLKLNTCETRKMFFVSFQKLFPFLK